MRLWRFQQQQQQQQEDSQEAHIESERKELIGLERWKNPERVLKWFPFLFGVLICKECSNPGCNYFITPLVNLIRFQLVAIFPPQTAN